MYKIRRLLLLLLLFGADAATGQTGVGRATFSARRPVSRPMIPSNLKTVKRGTTPEPALPDSSTNPIPATIADRPQDTLLRRRKLRVRFRG